MKIIAITALAVLLISCAHKHDSTETHKNKHIIKSDVLLQTSALRPYSFSECYDELTLTVAGKSLLEGIATFQVIDSRGYEVFCVTFPATDLIRAEYKTANSTLKKAHIKEVVDGYFVDYSLSDLIKSQEIARTTSDFKHHQNDFQSF